MCVPACVCLPACLLVCMQRGSLTVGLRRAACGGRRAVGGGQVRALDPARAAQLVFVGDTDQLPSVSAGNVLSDIIKCVWVGGP